MEKIKRYIKPIIYFYMTLFIYLIIITTLNYFDIVSYSSLSIISFIVIILLFMMIGFMTAMKSNKRGYINGLATGGFNLIVFSLLAVIFRANLKLSVILYFTILLLSSTIGGMFGINYKNKELK